MGSFYLAAGMRKTLCFPFYRGAEGTRHIPCGACVVAARPGGGFDRTLLALAYAEARLKPLHMFSGDAPVREELRSSLGWLAAEEAVCVFALRNAALLSLESGAPAVPAAVIPAAAAVRRFPRFGRRAEVRFGRPVPLLEKEMRYARLDREERKILVDNLAYRIARAVDGLSDER